MNIIETVVGGVALMLFGSQEYRMRRMRDDLNLKPTRREVSELVDLKQEASKVVTQDIKKDIEKLEKKIDKLIELQLNK